VSYSESIDLGTPQGRLMCQLLSCMAEYEACLIKERVRAGMALARLKGKAIGRKPIPPVYLARIISTFENEKLSVREIAKKTSMPRSTVFRTIKLFKAGQIDREGLPVRA